MKIGKRSLILLMILLIICPLLGNSAPFGIASLQKVEKALLFSLPIFYFLSFLIDCIKNKYKPKIDIFLILLLVFGFSLLLSMIFGINKNFNVITNLINYLYIIGFIYTIHVYDFSKEDLNKLLISIMISFALISIIGIIQYIFKIDVITRGIQKYPGATGRITSTMSNATILDKYLAFNLILFLYLLINNKNKLKTFLFIILLFIGCIALAFTYSRTGIFVFYASALLFLFIYLFKKKFVYALLPILLIVTIYVMPGQKYLLSSTVSYANTTINEVLKSLKLEFLSPINNSISKLLIVAPPEEEAENKTSKSGNDKEQGNETTTPAEKENQSLEKLEEYYTENDHSNASRKYYKDVAKSIIKEYPLTGIGIGNYNFIYKNQNINNYLKNKISNQEYLYPHDLFLHFTAETGCIGMISLLAILIGILIKSFKNNRFLITLFFFVSIIIFSLTESTLYMKDLAFWFIIVYALLPKKGYESKS